MLLARLNPSVPSERRHDERTAMPVLMRLTPLDDDGRALPEAAMIVVGKDVSRRGLSFFHERPLAYRRAIVTWEHPECGEFSAEIDVTWCQFTRPGWYVSGGRLLRAVSPDYVE
jgi:hypothetical protein